MSEFVRSFVGVLVGGWLTEGTCIRVVCMRIRRASERKGRRPNRPRMRLRRLSGRMKWGEALMCSTRRWWYLDMRKK